MISCHSGETPLGQISVRPRVVRVWRRPQLGVEQVRLIIVTVFVLEKTLNSPLFLLATVKILVVLFQELHLVL